MKIQVPRLVRSKASILGTKRGSAMLTVFALLLALMAVAPAQESGPQAEITAPSDGASIPPEELSVTGSVDRNFATPPGALYLTNQEIATANFADCGPLPTYAMTESVATDGPSQKAYLGRSFGALTCGTEFHFEFSEDTLLSESVRFRGWFACDIPSPGIGVDVRLTIDGEIVEGSRVAADSGELVCDGSSAFELDATMPTGDGLVEAGQVLGVEVLAFWVSPMGENDPAPNIHLLVGSTTHPTQLEIIPGDGVTPGDSSQAAAGMGLDRSAATPLPLDIGDAPRDTYSIEEALDIYRRNNSPDGPIAPDHQNANGIGPGSALVIGNGLCTAAWLLQDQDDEAYYLATAGHCLITAEATPPIDGSSPIAANRVEICFQDCLVNSAFLIDGLLGLRGDYLVLEQSGSYDPVAYAQAQGVGSDFGLIRIPPAANELLRPWLPQWGGATGIYPDGLGFLDTAVHFGHGAYCCPVVGAALTRTEFDQGRIAQFNFSDATSFQAFAGWASGGDSGSPVGRANSARMQSKGVPGDTAVGVLTHGFLPAHSGFLGTLLSHGINVSSAFVDNLALVTEDADINVEPPPVEHVDLYVGGDLVAEDISIGPTGPANQQSSWEVVVDFSPYEGQTVEIEAQWIDANGTLLDVDAVTVSVATPGEISITSPTAGQDIQPPFTFTGTFDTTSGPSGSSQNASSDELVALHQWLGSWEGFSTLSPRDDGGFEIYWEAAVPRGVPDVGPSGQTLYHREFSKAETLRGTSEQPYQLVSIDEAVTEYQESRPTGPEAPRAHDGIGPGSGLRLPGFVCSAAYLFEDANTGTYYLSTAGHCLVNDPDNATPRTGQNDPGAVVPTVDICVINCVANTVGGIPLGVYVRLAASGDYHPVAFAQSGGIGTDFGLIEIPRELNGALRPWMPQWGSPTGVHTAPLGLADTAVHYGHGAYCCPATFAAATRLPADQGRIAQFNFSDQDHFEAVAGDASGGDSGSGVGHADPTALASLEAIGDTGVGVLTHGLIIGHGSFLGTLLSRGINMAAPFVGFQSELVLQDDVIRPSHPTDPLSVSIDNPSDGTEIDPAVTPSVDISGTATFPSVAGSPDDAGVTYWLHRSDCGGDDVQWMDLVQGDVEDGGSGCGSATDPAGFLTSALWDGGSTHYVFPSDPAPDEEVLVDDSRTVQADIRYGGFVGEPTAITDLEGVLYFGGGGSNVVARGRASSIGEFQTIIPMTVENPVVPAGADLTFALIVHGSADIAFIDYGGPSGSRVEIPIAQAPDRSVEVSIDDSSFSPENLLEVTGEEDWTASWNVTGVTAGQHTIYARALQEGDASPVDSVNVTVGESVTGPTADFTWGIDNRTVSFFDSSTPGDAQITGWSWDFGDGNTSDQQNPVHSYEAFGTYDVVLTVVDADGETDSVEDQVILTAPPWSVEIQLTGPDGEAFGWTQVATPAGGQVGQWSFDWDVVEVPDGNYTLEAHLLRNGAVADTDSVDFTVISGKLIEASIASYDCDPSEWHFVITKINGGPVNAPSEIKVTWENGAQAEIPLTKFAGKVAHYQTALHLDSSVTEATAVIYKEWNGNFNLGSGPCN